MNIWLVTIGEPLPFDDDARLHRAGLLSQYIKSRGHDVTWWSSTFDHINKINLFDADYETITEEGIKLILLNGGGYKSNISLGRIKDHMKIANKFSEKAVSFPNPDIIICSYPTIELCEKAISFGIQNDIPVVIDIRDLWPDIFLDAAPSGLKLLIKIVIDFIYKNKVKKILKNATSIIGISRGYLDWSYTKYNRGIKELDKIFYLGYQKISPKKAWPNENLTLIDENYRSRKKIIFAGTFGKTYDLTIPIEAAKILNYKEESPLFIFCGTGENEAKWKKQAEGLNNILFTGWLGKSQLSYLLDISDFGLACYSEGAPQGIPNKIIEYLSFNLPILSSLEGESKSLIEGKSLGFNYKSGDLQSFLNSLEKIMDKDLAIELSKNCEETFESSFSASKVYNEYVNFIETLVI